jgi:hypothetical protein
MIKSLIIAILLLNSYINSLKSKNICMKTVECTGKDCSYSVCKDKLSYDCSRLECAESEELCDEYQQKIKYISLRKSIKADKLQTLGSIRGVTFVTKNLRKFDKLIKNIKECI